MHLRLTLTNNQHNPTRNEIASSERLFGEHYFEDLPLQWGGWIVLDDSFKLSAQWLLDIEYLDDVICHCERNEFPGYTVGVYRVDDSEEHDEKLV